MIINILKKKSQSSIPSNYWTSNDLFLIENSTPRLESEPLNDNALLYRSFNVGALICLDLYAGLYPFSPAMNPTNWNVRPNFNTWANQCVEAGCKYAVFTLRSETGFLLFDNPVPANIPNYTLGSTVHPIYPKYDISMCQNASQTLIEDFCRAMRAVNIEPILYLCVPINYNLDNQGRYLSIMPPDALLAYNNWTAKTLQYVVDKHKLRFVWLDNYNAESFCDLQKYYDAVKWVNPNCQVVSNCLADLNFERYPYDIGSHEELFSFSSGTDEEVFTPIKTHNYVNYKIGQEGVSTQLTTFNFQYYYRWEPLVERSDYIIQSFYNRCKYYNANFLLSLTPDNNGVISQPQIDKFKMLQL
jgi:alpha-L-fucosidase